MLAETQSAFVAALRDSCLDPPDGLLDPGGRPVARRFAVYRNNVVVGLIDALAATFVTVERLVGTEFFRAAARAYAVGTPPASPLLFRYGETFPDFLDRLPTLARYPYVADVAGVDWLWLQAYHTADAPVLAPETLAAIAADALPGTRLTPHPATRILPSAYPAATIWQRNRPAAGDRSDGGASCGPLPASGECVLLTRPRYEVRVRAIPPATGTFLAALSDHPLAEAAAAAHETDPTFDLTSAIALGLEAGAWTAAASG